MDILRPMPVYEFTCQACGATVSVFVRSISSPLNAVCQRCGSSDLRRLISRFAVLRSAGSMASLDDLDGMDENDPRALAAWARQMQREKGEDMGPEFDEMVSRLERGESLDDDGGGDFGMGDDHDHGDDMFGGL